MSFLKCFTNVQSINGTALRETVKLHANCLVSLPKIILYMSAAYIEHRPRSTDEREATTHYVIVVDGRDIGPYDTQKKPKDAACAKGYDPVHVARVRHLQDRDKPDHWRKDPC
jgi:hypothetical protein